MRSRVQPPRRSYPCAQCGGEYVVPVYKGQFFRFAEGHQFAGKVRVECIKCRRTMGVVDHIAATMRPFPLPGNNVLDQLLGQQKSGQSVSLLALAS